MDMEEIAKGYGRVPADQLLWLKKKGIPQETAEAALTAIYEEAAQGVLYADGSSMDQTLLSRARMLVAEDASANLRRQQERLRLFAEARLNEHLGYRRPAKWIRSPLRSLWYWRRSILSFLAGAATVGAAWAWISWR